MIEYILVVWLIGAKTGGVPVVVTSYLTLQDCRNAGDLFKGTDPDTRRVRDFECVKGLKK